MNNNLLVPIDGSRTSLRALDHAIDAARARKATIHVVNVEAPMTEYGMVQAYQRPSAVRKEATERAKAVLAPAVERLQKAKVPFESQVVWGETAEAIVRAAGRRKCGAIVMGTRGMSAAGNLLMGSVATKVVHLAKVPVTLVK
jgi:nucleotide-binding universal stress UspA family protein